MIHHQLAAALGFVALGANLLGALILILLNPGSRSVRWYMPFHAAIIVWLIGQGSNELWPGALWQSVDIVAAAMLPLLFLLFAMMEAPGRPTWHGVALLVVAVPLLPVVVECMRGDCGRPGETLLLLWYCGGWIGGPAILWWRGVHQLKHVPQRPEIRRKLVVLALLLVAPLSIVSTIFVQGPGFVLYVLPVITVLVQLLIFYGVIRMQFYDIEVRVRRSGDIAATTVELERLAVLGEVAATIAHEVRNPLTGVRSLAQRIAQDEIGADKRRKYADVILEETARVERLVGNLLQLARRGAMTPNSPATTTSLAALLDDLTLLVASRAERAGVRMVTDASEIEVTAPRESLTQVLLNLLLNAIAHSPHGGVITVSAVRDGDVVEIMVRDQGDGIAAGERDRVFDAFYTTSETGTGLGLSVVRHLAREHHWRVAIADAPGGGTVFTLSMRTPSPSPSLSRSRGLPATQSRSR